MSTTSLKLTDDLKQKAAAAARDLGITPHAFMVDAIKRAATAAEQRSQFLAEAEAARIDMLESGLGHDADDVHDYLRKRLSNRGLPRPTAKPWGE